MREWLTRGSSLCRSCARRREVGEFVAGFCLLVSDVVCNGACGKIIVSDISQHILTDLGPYRWLYSG